MSRPVALVAVFAAAACFPAPPDAAERVTATTTDSGQANDGHPSGVDIATATTVMPSTSASGDTTGTTSGPSTSSDGVISTEATTDWGSASTVSGSTDASSEFDDDTAAVESDAGVNDTSDSGGIIELCDDFDVDGGAPPSIFDFPSEFPEMATRARWENIALNGFSLRTTEIAVDFCAYDQLRWRVLAEEGLEVAIDPVAGVRSSLFFELIYTQDESSVWGCEETELSVPQFELIGAWGSLVDTLPRKRLSAACLANEGGYSLHFEVQFPVLAPAGFRGFELTVAGPFHAVEPLPLKAVQAYVGVWFQHPEDEALPPAWVEMREIGGNDESTGDEPSLWASSPFESTSERP